MTTEDLPAVGTLYELPKEPPAGSVVRSSHWVFTRVGSGQRCWRGVHVDGTDDVYLQWTSVILSRTLTLDPDGVDVSFPAEPPVGTRLQRDGDSRVWTRDIDGWAFDRERRGYWEWSALLKEIRVLRVV